MSLMTIHVLWPQTKDGWRKGKIRGKDREERGKERQRMGRERGRWQDGMSLGPFAWSFFPSHIFFLTKSSCQRIVTLLRKDPQDSFLSLFIILSLSLFKNHSLPFSLNESLFHSLLPKMFPFLILKHFLWRKNFWMGNFFFSLSLQFLLRGKRKDS